MVRTYPLPRIVIITAVPQTIRAFLLTHIDKLNKRGDVSVVSNFDNDKGCDGLGNVETKNISIHRKINIAGDVFALWGIYKFLKETEADIVFTVTPKAGLLGMIAGYFAGVPKRIHMFTGQVWATRQGISRLILKGADIVLARFSTSLLADSSSQIDFLVRESVVPAHAVSVIGNGSISGVDLDKFRFDEKARNSYRETLGFSKSTFVILFVGRVGREKGIIDLVKAFINVCNKTDKDIGLLIVGPDEGAAGEVSDIVAGRSNVVVYGPSNEVSKLMSASDVLCLPSYREGFGSVIIEAAAVGIPAVASRIYGIIDSVVDGETGLLHEPGNVEEIEDCLLRLAGNNELRARLGLAAHNRATRLFDKEDVSTKLADFLVG